MVRSVSLLFLLLLGVLSVPSYASRPTNAEDFKLELEQEQEHEDVEEGRGTTHRRRLPKVDIKQKANDAGQFAKQTGQSIKRGSQKFATNIKEGTQKVATNIKEGTQKAATNIKEGTQKVATNIKEGTQRAAKDIKEGTQRVATNIKEGSQKAANTVKQAASNAKTAVVVGAKSFKEDGAVRRRRSTVAKPPSVKDDDFQMPAYDLVARVRPQNLIEAQIPKSVANDIVKNLGDGSYWNGTRSSHASKAERGLTKATYDKEQVAPKLMVFSQYEDKNVIDFHKFVQMYDDKRIDADWAQPDQPAHGPPEYLEPKTLAKWLSDNFGYWQKFGGKRLAAAYVEEAKKAGCENYEDCHVYDKLIAFVSLDTKHDAALKIPQAMPALGTEAEIGTDFGDLSWDKASLVEDSDFAGMGFPSRLTKNVLSMCEGDAISSRAWESLNLDSMLTEFISRSKRPSKEDGNTDVHSTLRFHQTADLLPGGKDLDESNSFTESIAGTDQQIKVPTFDEVLGENNKGRLELGEEDIERWLLAEEQGMKNKWLFGTDKKKYALQMAKEVLRWGDGSVPGIDSQGFSNGKLQGSQGSHDQFADVAPRMALFIQLDSDHDGELEFTEAFQYLKAAVAEKA